MSVHVLLGDANRVDKHLLHIDPGGQHASDEGHGRLVAHLIQVRPVPKVQRHEKIN